MAMPPAWLASLEEEDDADIVDCRCGFFKSPFVSDSGLSINWSDNDCEALTPARSDVSLAWEPPMALRSRHVASTTFELSSKNGNAGNLLTAVASVSTPEEGRPLKSSRPRPQNCEQRGFLQLRKTDCSSSKAACACGISSNNTDDNKSKAVIHSDSKISSSSSSSSKLAWGQSHKEKKSAEKVDAGDLSSTRSLSGSLVSTSDEDAQTPQLATVTSPVSSSLHQAHENHLAAPSPLHWSKSSAGSSPKEACFGSSCLTNPSTTATQNHSDDYSIQNQNHFHLNFKAAVIAPSASSHRAAAASLQMAEFTPHCLVQQAWCHSSEQQHLRLLPACQPRHFPRRVAAWRAPRQTRQKPPSE